MCPKMERKESKWDRIRIGEGKRGQKRKRRETEKKITGQGGKIRTGKGERG